LACTQVQSYKSRVQFKAACAAIPEDAVVLEVGPHAIMRAPLRQNCAGLPYVGTMKKGDDATLSLREAVAGLWRKGAALKWSTPEEGVPGGRATSFGSSCTPNMRACG
jgi:fatty acid synthase